MAQKRMLAKRIEARFALPATLLILLAGGAAAAQQPSGMRPGQMMDGGAHCAMCGGMAVVMLVLTVAAIAALVALAVYLVRRSRPRSPAET